MRVDVGRFQSGGGLVCPSSITPWTGGGSNGEVINDQGVVVIVGIVVIIDGGLHRHRHYRSGGRRREIARNPTVGVTCSDRGHVGIDQQSPVDQKIQHRRIEPPGIGPEGNLIGLAGSQARNGRFQSRVVGIALNERHLGALRNNPVIRKRTTPRRIQPVPAGEIPDPSRDGGITGNITREDGENVGLKTGVRNRLGGTGQNRQQTHEETGGKAKGTGPGFHG